MGLTKAITAVAKEHSLRGIIKEAGTQAKSLGGWNAKKLANKAINAKVAQTTARAAALGSAIASVRDQAQASKASANAIQNALDLYNKNIAMNATPVEGTGSSSASSNSGDVYPVGNN